MPLFYCSYMMVMVHLQSAQYHREMIGITRNNVVTTIVPLLVFGILQIASFVVLVLLIKHNCGMRALYQLAFVLEKQRALVQCKMVLWMLITLCFRVQHFGALSLEIDIVEGMLIFLTCVLMTAQVLISSLNLFVLGLRGSGYHKGRIEL